MARNPAPERRDGLQQIVDGMLADEERKAGPVREPPIIIQGVTDQIQEWVWRQSRDQHRTYDKVAYSSFVQRRYTARRHSARPGSDAITEKEVAAGGQLVLPEMQELLAWRVTFDFGKHDKAVSDCTLAELHTVDADYERRQIEFAAKRRYIGAIIREMQKTPVDNETVVEFYRRTGRAS